MDSCTTYHIFPVLPINNLVKQDGEPNAPHKLVTGTKPSVSNIYVLFCPCVVRKSTAHVDGKALNMLHQSQKGFQGRLNKGNLEVLGIRYKRSKLLQTLVPALGDNYIRLNTCGADSERS